MKKGIYFIIIILAISLNFCINIFANDNIEYNPTEVNNCNFSEGYFSVVGDDPQVRFSNINIKKNDIKGFLIEFENIENTQDETIKFFWNDEASKYKEEHSISFLTKNNVSKYYIPIKNIENLDNDLEYIESIIISPNLKKTFKIKLIAVFNENEEILNYDISISKDKINIIITVINEAFEKIFWDKTFIISYLILLIFTLLIIFKLNKILKNIKE